MQGEDFWLMVVCCMTAGLIALLLVLTAHAEQQAHDLGWLAQKQIQARAYAADVLKARYDDILQRRCDPNGTDTRIHMGLR